MAIEELLGGDSLADKVKKEKKKKDKEKDKSKSIGSIFGGALSGTILQLVPNRLIVQSWRSTEFARGDLDSTLILSFWPERPGARIELTHANVADSDFAGVSEGWGRYYWTPWRNYLTAQTRQRPKN